MDRQTISSCLRPAAGFVVLQLCLCFALWAVAAVHCQAGIGIYNWQISAADGAFPVRIGYRLNCAGSVSIEMLDEADQVVAVLGPFEEPAGLCQREWDGSGAGTGLRRCRARIRASNPGIGTSGKLERLAGHSGVRDIYGVAVDRWPASPGYGTIYVSNCVSGGRLLAYYADGSPKRGFGGNPSSNALALGFSTLVGRSPWGVGVDEAGRIYVASSAAGSTSGIKVFDHLGNLLRHVFVSQAQSISWLEGLSASGGMEIYESLGAVVRASGIEQELWSDVIVPGVPNAQTRQMCFEPGGMACYVAVRGISTDPDLPNEGVFRYTRRESGEWVRDTEFDCGLRAFTSGAYIAANYAAGVTCDSRGPEGPYRSRWLWVGLDCPSNQFGGNVVRKRLPDGEPEFFWGPGVASRIIASDSAGNLFLEHASMPSSDPLWPGWSLMAPGGEPSSDMQLTGFVQLSGSASPEPVDTVQEALSRADGGLVEFTVGKTVSAVFAGCFYIAEPDQCRGVRCQSLVSVMEGDVVRVRGRLQTVEGERVLIDVETIP